MTNNIMKSGIRKRVVISILVVGILPLVIGLYLTYREGTTTRKNSIGTSFREIAKDTANKIDMVIKKEIIDVQRFAISPDIRKAIKKKGYGRGEVNNYIKRFIGYGDEKEIYSLIIVDANGDYIAGIKEAAGKKYSDERWFKDSFNNGRGKIYVGDLLFDDASGMHLMSIAAPVMENPPLPPFDKGGMGGFVDNGRAGHDGKAIGAVVIKYRVDKLLEFITNVRIENTGHANLVDSSGTIIMSPVFPLRSRRIDPELLISISTPSPGWGTAKDEGINSIIGFAPVESTLNPEKGWFDGNRWHVFIRQGPDKVYAPIYSLLIRISIFGIVLITIISFAGVYAARKIVGPINQLYKGVGHIGEGNLDYRLNIKTNDEIEELADEFNAMAGKLQESYSILDNRKRELEASEDRYKDLIENSPEMVHSVNADRCFVDVNKTELDILGYTLAEMKQKRMEDIVPKEFKEKVINHVLKTIKKREGSVEAQFITKDGKRIDVDIIATALYHPVTGNFIRTRAFVRDITDRKRLERYLKGYYELLEQKVYDRTKELKETKDYLENLFETANDVIYRLNPSGMVTYVNKKVEEWGYRKEELLGKSFLTVLSKEHKGERFKRTVMEGIKQTYGVEVISKSGEKRYAILSISPIRNNEGRIVEVLGIANDITEQKKFEQQIARTEKMSAIGQLAAGSAHEINNPLGGILNCLYNLRKKRFSAEKEEEYYKSMEDGIYRVKKIVSQLLDFSQQHEPEYTSVDINSVVDEILFMLNYAFSKDGISIQKSLDSNLPLLMIDRHKMVQVLTNILLNSIQAIKGKGQITVRTGQENGWCRIDIADTGGGIPENILPRVFDPFFTTKGVGEGTGLGLSVSKGIVDMHNGRIDIISEPERGSTFIIRLPIHNPVEYDNYDNIDVYNRNNVTSK